jgi:hypothetical protein
MNEQLYNLRVDDKESGPYTLAQLQVMWASGAINAATFWWTEGLGDWQPLSTLEVRLRPPAASPTVPPKTAPPPALREFTNPNLKFCPACRAQVSNETDICPHCGHPIKRGFLGKAGTERVLNVGCLIIVLVVLALVVLGSCSGLLSR